MLDYLCISVLGPLAQLDRTKGIPILLHSRGCLEEPAELLQAVRHIM